MKRNDAFLLSEIAGEYYLIPTGKAGVNFNKMITLNDVGAFIWKKLDSDKCANEIAKDICEEYQVNFEKALSDTNAFAEKMFNLGCFED